ncbi:MAG: hypothetical protein U0587_11830 [Candidatus Binatia bacterium]
MPLDPSQDVHAIAAATVRDQVLIAAHRRRGESMAQAPDKVTALLDAARMLDEIGCQYALIGGVAVGIHSGLPRATADTDIALVSTTDRASLARVLSQAGFRLVGEFPHSANFRHRSGEPVQFVFDQAFDEMIQRADHFSIAGISIAIVRKPDLIAMKQRAAADPARRRSKALQDQADVELLRGDVPQPDEGW